MSQGVKKWQVGEIDEGVAMAQITISFKSHQ